MANIGAFIFMLNAHVPSVRLPLTPATALSLPQGEAWLHDATLDTYLPLLETFYDLAEAGVPFRLMMVLSPTLMSQLMDPTLQANFDAYLAAKIEAAEADIARHDPQQGAQGHINYLAQWYRQRFKERRQTFNERFKRDIVGAFKRLQDEGYLEIAATAATHAYLPLLSHDSSLKAQIKLGIQVYERVFGRTPRAFWLPECAYRPAQRAANGDMRPGIEHFLAEAGIQAFFTDAHAIRGGQPEGTGNSIGPHGDVQGRYVLPPLPEVPEHPATSFWPYKVADTSTGGGRPAGVMVMGRNAQIGQQVWSAQQGYPGDFDYRERHRKHGLSGLHYWRITGDSVTLADKDFYMPEWADYKIEQHAEHFSHVVGDLLRDFQQMTGHEGVMLASFDAALFGHWWYEGPLWLGRVLRALAEHPDVDLTTPSAYLQAHPPLGTLTPKESSWGAGGAHFAWNNADNHWLWPLIHECEREMAELALNHTEPSEPERRVLNQAARELLMLQASDWPFLITTGMGRDYAIQRFAQHLDRFKKLVISLANQAPDVSLAEELWALDPIFPEMDYRWFGA